MVANAASSDGSVFRCGAKVINVVVPPAIADLVPDWGKHICLDDFRRLPVS